MDRYWYKQSTGKSEFLDLQKFTATETLKRLKKQRRKSHFIVQQRALLEASGIPVNKQLTLRWSDIYLLEAIIDHVDWINVGINSLLYCQDEHGTTPLIKPRSKYEVWCNTLGLLNELNSMVIEFKRKKGIKSKGFAQNEFIRFFETPVGRPGYRGMTIICDVYKFNFETPYRMPMIIEISNVYPRYMHTGENSKLSVEIDINGLEKFSADSNNKFISLLPKAKKFVRDYAIQIYNLAKCHEAHLITLDFEYLLPDWLRVFDYSVTKIPAYNRALSYL